MPGFYCLFPLFRIHLKEQSTHHLFGYRKGISDTLILSWDLRNT